VRSFATEGALKTPPAASQRLNAIEGLPMLTMADTPGGMPSSPAVYQLEIFLSAWILKRLPRRRVTAHNTDPPQHDISFRLARDP
jgi:hypothetical protein